LAGNDIKDKEANVGLENHGSTFGGYKQRPGRAQSRDVWVQIKLFFGKG
jgi:hypothetical protein